jgi:GNAT superfamily N-acetyltransferase
MTNPSMNIPSLLIRPARWSDWPQLRRLLPLIFPHMSNDEVSYLLRRHHSTTVVACRELRQIGYYQFYPHDEPGVVWLNHFGVTPDARGHGEAKALLAFFERHAKTCGFDSIALDAFEDNVRAHRFYERSGFTRLSKLTHDDGVKFRFRKLLSGVAPLDHSMPSIRPPGASTRALRKLAYGLLTWRP